MDFHELAAYAPVYDHAQFCIEHEARVRKIFDLPLLQKEEAWAVVDEYWNLEPADWTKYAYALLACTPKDRSDLLTVELFCAINVHL